MKKFKKVDQEKIEKLLKDSPEKSLLKNVLGGAGPICNPAANYADSIHYSNYMTPKKNG